MRRLVWQVVSLLLVGGFAFPLVGQDVGEQLADRAPRFLLAMTGTAKPAAVDATSVPVLRQHITLDLDGVTVEEALTAISREAGLRLVYSKAIVPLEGRVRLQATNITVAGALTEVLLDAGVDVLLTTRGQAVLVKRPPTRPVQLQPGSIAGRVTDGKTGTALAGATIAVEGSSRSATSGSDGRYRISEVAPGAYTLRARFIGYAPATATATVSEGQEATADFALEKSAQRLDEVVTTGTVVPTEVKALPTPISVITGDDIEQKGYQRVDQIFRGDVPGAIAWDNGALGYYSDVNIRGASSIGANYVKTYIDGVEVADPTFIATIDPASIDRVEVLRGPQGSTIYGSNASSGVMRIFTKKGTYNTLHPEVDAKVSAGLIESPWVNGAKLEQDHSLGVTGGGPGFSYRMGGGYSHQGEWAPEFYSKNLSLNGGLRGTQGPLTVELSTRYYAKNFGQPLDPRFRDAGYQYFSKPLDQSYAIRQQTYGLTVAYAVTSAWQHNLVLGYDRHGLDNYSNHPRFTTPDDSLFFVYSYDESKASVGYNTVYAHSLGPAVQSSLTAGIDHWAYHQGGFYAGSATSNSNTISSPDQAYRVQYNNTGYFAQGQFGFWNAVFLTAGLRAEDNQNFGNDFGLAWAPRVGISYVHTSAGITAKARAAYGKALRAPAQGQAEAARSAFSNQLANPTLGPEEQRGWDGGIELYFGTRASLEGTYYNQTAIDLIDLVQLDATSAPPVFQYQNVGRIKNKGWEFLGRVNAGPLTLAGTLSITSSVVRTLSPTYTGDLQPGDQVLHIPRHTAGATLSYDGPRTTVTVGMTYVGSWVETDWVALYGFYYGGQPYRGSGRAYWITYPSFAKFNLSFSQALSSRFGVFLRSDNFTNNDAFERYNFNLNAGRVTMVGVRTRL